MLEPIEVPTGTIPPYCCIVCRGTEGPLIDTHAEIPGLGRIYLCKNLCVRSLARVAGYAKGKRQTELLDAQTMADRYAADLTRTQERVAELERINENQATRAAEARATIEHLEQRLAQVSEAANAQAAHILDVTAGASA